jgi:hypothetical protein
MNDTPIVINDVPIVMNDMPIVNALEEKEIENLIAVKSFDENS